MADSYLYHRLALAPLISDDPQAHFKQAIKNTDFLSFLIRNQLGPLWHETLSKTQCQRLFPQEFQAELQKSSRVTAAQYLRQHHSLKESIDTALREQSIPYAVFKGVHIREIIYENPAVRYACDIDILISKTDKVKAIRSLVAAGFFFYPTAENISHEATLTNGRVSIDLHWDILRPGRTRKDMTDAFLAERKAFPGYQALNNEATLFIMLVHPVFTKYSTAPHASLLHLVDLHRWATTQQIDWEKLFACLEQSGLKTAAWITATRLEMVTEKSLPRSFVQKIRPAALKARYLRAWLDKNFSTCLLSHPHLIQAGFTLPAHDTFADALRFMKLFLQEKKTADQKTKHLLNQF